jgi:transcriptional regulator with XRE-family HTH domain
VTTIVLMPHVDGEKLRRLREERFLSHRELANLAGVSPTTVINLETNQEISPQRRTIRKLARALEVDPHELTRRPADA